MLEIEKNGFFERAISTFKTFMNFVTIRKKNPSKNVCWLKSQFQKERVLLCVATKNPKNATSRLKKMCKNWLGGYQSLF